MDIDSDSSPLFSLAWNIAEEKFIKKHLEWMNMFKLRYSYGKVGNDKIGVNVFLIYIQLLSHIKKMIRT